MDRDGEASLRTGDRYGDHRPTVQVRSRAGSRIHLRLMTAAPPGVAGGVIASPLAVMAVIRPGDIRAKNPPRRPLHSLGDRPSRPDGAPGRTNHEDQK